MTEISYLSAGDETYEIKDSDARERLDDVCLNTLHITFSSEFLGQKYTVTGGSESYEGVVPDSLEVELGLLEHNTTYTVSATDESGVYTCSKDAKTGPYFNHYELELSLGPIFSNMSWAYLSEISASGEASSYWAIGDRHVVELNGTVGCLDFDHETYYAYIIGFDHNADIEGANRIHMQFGFDEGGNHIAFIDSDYNSAGSNTGFRMNTSNTNSGGWESSYMRNTICPQFKEALPEDLQNVLNTVTKYTGNTGGKANEASEVTSTTDDVFLLAEYEIFGERTGANSYEQDYQEQYEYYSLGNSKIMYRHSNPSSACGWWTRSAYAGNTYYFRYVYTSGSSGSDYAYYSNGFAPAFTI